jgi:hypothetical protein
VIRIFEATAALVLNYGILSLSNLLVLASSMALLFYPKIFWSKQGQATLSYLSLAY